MTKEEKNISKKDWEAAIIVRAWKDDNFKKKLLENPEAALREANIPYPSGCKLSFTLAKKDEVVVVIPQTPKEMKELGDKDLSKLAAGIAKSEYYYEGKEMKYKPTGEWMHISMY